MDMRGRGGAGLGGRLDLPPLLRDAPADGDPVAQAVRAARDGTEAGLICHRLSPARLQAALVLVPETTLDAAAAMLPLGQVALAEAIGQLGPSELAVQLGWAGGIHVNGAACGRLALLSDSDDPAAEPLWLVLALDLPLAPSPGGPEPGAAPEVTTLSAEGAPLDARALLEAWARHVLVWIHLWSEDGMKALHETWRSRAWPGDMPDAETDRPAGLPPHFPDGTPVSGKLTGHDAGLGLLLRQDDGRHLSLPLCALVERPAP
ncbi:biotin/lipoate--protein ligase family protein [Oceanomicrobium pacificus]|uniref:BPL/LPL catalytic domain-containing protein n=1 Tax=Oceanomicrobium pacificus TaxID=2692916 RepID=A0A6B0TXL5_9RHOB|nr:biotin/lipoate--protein ligase family protein [Oceanomicrobium pacificus]MXU66445.1 hypothetical protein [Oceanomicrobium pacificus]